LENDRITAGSLDYKSVFGVQPTYTKNPIEDLASLIEPEGTGL